MLYEELLSREGEEYIQEEADTAAMEEFTADANASAAGTMGRVAFEGGMFELADLHVPDLEASNYVAFLAELLRELRSKYTLHVPVCKGICPCPVPCLHLPLLFTHL